jgi:SWI/SNF-related matrix-associated actin-dependent regulator 1 of chromatin subfamily A
MLRRTKEQVLDLPPLFVNNLMIDAAIPRDLKELEAELGPAVVKALRRYEAGDDTALSAIQTHVARLRRLIGSIKAPEVARVLSDRLEGNEGQPVICFAWHSEVVESIRDRLRASGYRVATIVGADSQPARQRAVDDFQAGKLDCIIGNIQAAGVGITLTASRYEIFAESSWVPADNAQAMMRAHRIGQKHAVNVDFATLARSIDETIEAANMRKARDFSRIFKEKEA